MATCKECLHVKMCWLLQTYGGTGDAAPCNEFKDRSRFEEDAKKWIPVTERLPKEHDSCIVYRKGTFGHFSMLRYTPALGFHFYDSEWGDVTVDNVTHWMPLPEPPKEVE